jgi:hypothetical protein
MPERRMTRIALECRRPVQNKHARGAEQQEHVTEELAIVKKKIPQSYLLFDCSPFQLKTGEFMMLHST